MDLFIKNQLDQVNTAETLKVLKYLGIRTTPLLRVGSICCSQSVNELLKVNPRPITRALERFISLDWGELEQEDQELNNNALDYAKRLIPGNRIVASYNIGAENLLIIMQGEGEEQTTTLMLNYEY